MTNAERQELMDCHCGDGCFSKWDCEKDCAYWCNGRCTHNDHEAQTPQTSDLSRMGTVQYDNACVIGKFLDGTKYQGSEAIIRRLQCEAKSFRAE